MENIRRSFFGYNKNDVRNLIFEKDQIIHTQQKDIDYLRAQTQKAITDQINSAVENANHNSSRFVNLEQARLEKQIELE